MGSFVVNLVFSCKQGARFYHHIGNIFLDDQEACLNATKKNIQPNVPKCIWILGSLAQMADMACAGGIPEWPQHRNCQLLPTARGTGKNLVCLRRPRPHSMVFYRKFIVLMDDNSGHHCVQHYYEAILCEMPFMVATHRRPWTASNNRKSRLPQYILQAETMNRPCMATCLLKHC